MEYMREWREKAGLSQEELAYRVGKHSNTIARYERGERTPSLDAIQDIATALNITPAQLLSAPPKEARYTTILKFGKVRKELENAVTDFEDLDGFHLTLDPAGAIAINGGRPIKTRAERDAIKKELDDLIDYGYDVQVKRGLAEA